MFRWADGSPYDLEFWQPGKDSDDDDLDDDDDDYNDDGDDGDDDDFSRGAKQQRPGRRELRGGREVHRQVERRLVQSDRAEAVSLHDTER